MATAAIIGLLVLFYSSVISGEDIQWYRTAQGTGDRLTKQANISFGNDFESDAFLLVNR